MNKKSDHTIYLPTVFTFRALDYCNNFEGAKPNDFLSIIKPKVYQFIKQKKAQGANVPAVQPFFVTIFPIHPSRYPVLELPSP